MVKPIEPQLAWITIGIDMSDYQISFLDRRVQYLEGKVQEWEKVIDILMADPTFMHTLGVKDLKKNQNTNIDPSYKVKDPYK